MEEILISGVLHLKQLNFLLLLLAFACHPSKKTSTESTPVSPPAEPEPVIEKSSGPNSRVICKAPDGVNNDPRTIADVVALINALPKPVSVACLIDSLKGPFKVNATASEFSAQPAFGVEAPRIFLFYSPLLISVVPAGEGAKVVEVSDRTGPEESVKGEIPFPVTENIASDLPYLHIKYDQGDGTVCGTCHFSEVIAPSPYPPSAYVSRYLLPAAAYDVTAKEIEESAKRCAKTKLPECQILEALTSKGKLIQTSFE